MNLRQNVNNEVLQSTAQNTHLVQGIASQLDSTNPMEEVDRKTCCFLVDHKDEDDFFQILVDKWKQNQSQKFDTWTHQSQEMTNFLVYQCLQEMVSGHMLLKGQSKWDTKK